ncbi:MAG TPA: hypothetical protein VMT31_03025 [Methanomicrobiales archaeon]|nr:hypothetical protein [Methanomicrobiales archaeon]
MGENLSNTISSFVNTDWLLSLCEQEILNERKIHEGIGGGWMNPIAQAELRGYIRAIRKIQELTLLPITEDVATLSCDEIQLDENGDIIILKGRIEMQLSSREIESGVAEEIKEFIVQFGATKPHPVIPGPWISASMGYRNQPPGPSRSPRFEP